ncbi:hypothetical protein E2C01_046771 [Portunus trituberculatus]|uniref:Uncharacterized protein n=1 Tax=Portunus trituberculatus TaxID=210409 RepID=A0A5B7FZF0_PORTR|nr:hypothetical protein [Portunus trituberculatus]
MYTRERGHFPLSSQHHHHHHHRRRRRRRSRRRRRRHLLFTRVHNKKYSFGQVGQGQSHPRFMSHWVGCGGASLGLAGCRVTVRACRAVLFPSRVKRGTPKLSP